MLIVTMIVMGVVFITLGYVIGYSVVTGEYLTTGIALTLALVLCGLFLWDIRYSNRRDNDDA